MFKIITIYFSAALVSMHIWNFNLDIFKASSNVLYRICNKTLWRSNTLRFELLNRKISDNLLSGEILFSKGWIDILYKCEVIWDNLQKTTDWIRNIFDMSASDSSISQKITDIRKYKQSYIFIQLEWLYLIANSFLV